MSELQQIIHAEIESGGPMTCARFMELALYHPEYGYYEKRSNQVGRSGDFITSVSVGDLFGRLLAERFAKWLEELESRGVEAPFQIVEAGAHQGQLAADVLQALQSHHRELLAKVEYVIVEPSSKRETWQREFLKPWHDKVAWWPDWEDSVYGVVFSNELLDAFPVHRHVWRETKWRELALGEDLNWIEIDGEFPHEMDPEVLAAIPDGFVAEHAPGAIDWWQRAADALKAGWLMTFDYGFESEAPISPDLPEGTLRAYKNHQRADDLLAFPGEQDLTAHVNWPVIRKAGEARNLASVELVDQSRFLTRILADAAARNPHDWQLQPKEVRQFQMLTHPEHLGRKFQVLAQQR